MKDQLPVNHGLSDFSKKEFVYEENGEVSITEAQYSALDAGVAKGESMLVVSPTSTGKTQIAVWAMIAAIEKGYRCVYLVTHRALARQKFTDFIDLFGSSLLNNDYSSLVLATGDFIVDANNEIPADPLSSPVVVATYEKYLAMLAAAGVPASMEGTLFICDEVQLIGDHNRGKNVELLITLLKNCGWYQFVGLSAVLDEHDAHELANWLDVKLLRSSVREKHLTYECWTAEKNYVKTTLNASSDVQEVPAKIHDINTINIVKKLLEERSDCLPLIVFCMSKARTYTLADQFEREYYGTDPQQLTLLFDNLPATKANSDLARYLPHRFAVHSADLTDEERDVVEKALLNNEIDVLFSTSTLAAGVNFPLGIAIFDSWKRWDPDQRQYLPIDAAEFHNMAGRVGRMGTDHADGTIVFSLERPHEIHVAAQYLEFDKYTNLSINLSHEQFKQIVLQLVSSGITRSFESLCKLLKTTFSGLMTLDTNKELFDQWERLIGEALKWDISNGLIVSTATGALEATPLGRSVSQSGLLPETALYVIDYFITKGEALVNIFSSETEHIDIDVIDYALMYLFYSTPEFQGTDAIDKTRFIPWPLANGFVEPPSIESIKLLSSENWRAELNSTNAAFISSQWLHGKKLGEIEIFFQDLRAGMILEMFRNMNWVAQGVAQILTALTNKKNIPFLNSANYRISEDYAIKLRSIIRYIYQLSNRISTGLPAELIWMLELNKFEGYSINREEIMELSSKGITRIEDAMRGDSVIEAIRVDVFAKAKPAPQVKSSWFRDSSRNLKRMQREKAKERQQVRAHKCIKKELVQEYYDSLGNDFEKVFENILDFLKINYDKLDNHGVVGAPDYLVLFDNDEPLVVELKSKQNDNLVDYNKASEVLTASEVHGHKDKYCVTLCHPGVDPSVPSVIARCGRLTVIESVDFGEALLRICEGTLTRSQIVEWITRPGQALIVDLPFVTKEGVLS